MENKGLRVNMKNTKLIVTGPGLDVLSDSGAFPSAVCRDGVGSSNAIKCSQCKLLVHKSCSSIQGRIVANPNYVCPRCRGQSRPNDGRPVTQVDVDGTLLDVEASFCYLGDILSAGGCCSLAIIVQVLYCLGKVQEAPGNLDIQAHIPHSSWEGVRRLCPLFSSSWK